MGTTTDRSNKGLVAGLIRFSIRNRLLAAVLCTGVMIAGYAIYTSLPVDAFPDVSPVLVQVFTVTEGLAPEEVEKYVTYPVEVAMTGLPDVEMTRSVSNFGLSVVNVYFSDGTDIYFARQLVGERLQEAREKIPEGFGEPQMGPISTSMGMVLDYYLEDESGQRDLEELRTIQDWIIKFHLQTVPGVTEVLGIGGYEKQYQVVVRPDDLLRYSVTLPEVIEKIEKNNLNVGAQYMVKNGEEFVVRSEGLVTTLEDIGNIVVKSIGGTPVYLRHLADIHFGPAIRRGLQTRNGGGEVVAGMVIKLYGTNSSEVIERVESKIAEINNVLPQGVRIVPYYEQKTLVQASVNTISNALLMGIVLVVIVLAVLLGAVRPSLIVSLSIPFSVLFAILGMGIFGISVNLMSFGGLAIAIGILVDGTIGVVENVHRRLQETGPDEPRSRTIFVAATEVARPILFAILIIMVVFVPLFTLQGVEGKTFRPMAYTLTLALLGSLIFAVLMAPALSSYILRRKNKPAAAGKTGTVLTRVLERGYEPVVSMFVQRRWLALGLAGVILAAGVLLLPFLGAEFVPRQQEGTIVCRLTMAPSISLEESAHLTTLVERRLMKIPEVESAVSRVGRGEVGAHSHPPNIVECYVGLKPKSQWRGQWSQDRLEEIIRSELGEVPAVKVNVTQPIEMTVEHLLEGIKAQLAIKLFGEDLELLKRKGDEIAEVVHGIEGAVDVQAQQITGSPQLLVSVDREAIARYGLNVSDVQSVVSAAVGGKRAGEVLEGVRRFDIYVRYPEKFRSDKRAVENLLVQAPGGELIPLQQLASVRELVGPREITRQDSQRFIAIECNVEGRDISTFVQEASRAIEERVDLPPGYLVTWGGQFRLQQEANARLFVVVPIALLLIFLLLYSCYRSISNSALILINIPLALVGGIAGLWLTGQYISIPATVGFIALLGVALEDGMVLVTMMNQFRAQGLDPDEAGIRGAVRRLMPVLTTTATTALGLVPLLFATGSGSEIQRPLATVVVCGLITSTLMTLLVLPALFRFFQPRREAARLRQDAEFGALAE